MISEIDKNLAPFPLAQGNCGRQLSMSSLISANKCEQRHLLTELQQSVNDLDMFNVMLIGI